MIGELDPFKGKEDERGGWGEIWKRKRGHKSFSIMIPPKWVQMICDVLIQRGGEGGVVERGTDALGTQPEREEIKASRKRNDPLLLDG